MNSPLRSNSSGDLLEERAYSPGTVIKVYTYLHILKDLYLNVLEEHDNNKSTGNTLNKAFCDIVV